MKSQILWIAGLLCLPLFAQAQPARLVYEGYLSDDADQPVNGQQTLTFRVYDGPTR